MKDQQTSFEKLKIYQMAEKLADLLWNEVKRWPYHERDTVGKQMVRCADSVGANIAEGLGRQSPGELIQFTRYACGSLYETKHWLRQARRRELLASDTAEEVDTLIGELLPRLNAYLASARRRATEGRL